MGDAKPSTHPNKLYIILVVRGIIDGNFCFTPPAHLKCTAVLAYNKKTYSYITIKTLANYIIPFRLSMFLHSKCLCVVTRDDRLQHTVCRVF